MSSFVCIKSKVVYQRENDSFRLLSPEKRYLTLILRLADNLAGQLRQMLLVIKIKAVDCWEWNDE